MNSIAKTTLQVIFERKSVRNFIDKQVSKEYLEILVRAGMAAPAGMIRKFDRAFIAINDRLILDKLEESLPYMDMLKKSGGAIVVCGVLSEAPEGWARELWIQNCSAATQNILLAAESLGLGAVWTTGYPSKIKMAAVIEILDLPDHIVPLNVIPLGYPAEFEKPKDKWNPDNLHWQKW